MYESHRAEVIPAIAGVGAAATVIVALRRVVFPGFWISRATQPTRFWLYIAATAMVAAGCLALIVTTIWG
jgi:hypothetical protein